MAEILKNNKIALRGCILYEFLQGKSIDQAYESFCKTIGNDVLKHKEFKNWFNSFANGKADLEDECFDKEPLTFSDLSNKILGKIVEKLDLVDRLRTRKVSRRLRIIVNIQNADYGVINIFTAQNQVEVLFDGKLVAYKKKGNQCLIEVESEQKVLNGDFLEIALNDLAIVMKKPKLHVKHLNLSFGKYADSINGKVLKFLESLKYPIHVEFLRIQDGHVDISQFLSLLKPGTLEDIFLDNKVTGTNMGELVKMEQWRQLKTCYIGWLTLVEIERCLDFKEFEIFVDSVSLYVVAILTIFLSTSTNFEYCLVKPRRLTPIDTMAEIAKHFGIALTIDNFDPVFGTCNFHVTYESLEFEINSKYIVVEKGER